MTNIIKTVPVKHNTYKYRSNIRKDLMNVAYSYPPIGYADGKPLYGIAEYDPDATPGILMCACTQTLFMWDREPRYKNTKPNTWMQLDHKRPKIYRGAHVSENLQLLQAGCNQSKLVGTHCEIHGTLLSEEKVNASYAAFFLEGEREQPVVEIYDDFTQSQKEIEQHPANLHGSCFILFEDKYIEIQLKADGTFYYPLSDYLVPEYIEAERFMGVTWASFEDDEEPF